MVKLAATAFAVALCMPLYVCDPAREVQTSGDAAPRSAQAEPSAEHVSWRSLRSSGSPAASPSSVNGNTSTTVTRNSWFQRIKESFIKCLIGIVLFLLAFPLLTYNEGSFVVRLKTIDAAREQLQGGDQAKLANEQGRDAGSIIHVSGPASAQEAQLVDAQTGVAMQGALRMRRKVEMLQMVESESSEEHKDMVGGGSTTVTNFTVSEEWSDKPVEFENKGNNPNYMGCQNPPFPVESEDIDAKSVTIQNQNGAPQIQRLLNPSQMSRLDAWTPVPITDSHVKAAAKVMSVPGRSAVMQGPSVLFGNPSQPSWGDIKITWEYVGAGDYTVLAKDTGDSFEIWEPAGVGDYELPFFCCGCIPPVASLFQLLGSTANDIDVIKPGTWTAEEILDDEAATNATMLTVIRVVGFLCFLLGVYLFLSPVATLFDVIGFLGSIVRFGAFIAGLCAALVLTPIVIAFAWLYYRPLRAFLLLMVAAVAFTAIKQLSMTSDEYASASATNFRKF